METKTRLAVKDIVKNTTGCTHVESTTITMMLEVKVALEQRSHGEALRGLLALIIRSYGIPAVRDIDDLTKLLNTGEDRFTNIRAMINGMAE